MPEPDAGVISQRQPLVTALRKLLPEDCVIDDERGLRPFECDGLSAYRALPMVVVLPRDTGEISRVLALCHDRGVKIVPRGAGTGLSGGALPLADGVTVGFGKLNRILEIDTANRCAVVQPGVANLAISTAVSPYGFYYAPDPSSQISCSIGGNVAENSGGVHCLKYGLTTNNLLGIEMVLMDGEVLRLGGKQFDAEGYDMLGVVTGSEGLLGAVTEVTVRILPKPATVRALLLGFPDNASAVGAKAVAFEGAQTALVVDDAVLGQQLAQRYDQGLPLADDARVGLRHRNHGSTFRGPAGALVVGRGGLSVRTRRPSMRAGATAARLKRSGAISPGAP